MPNGIGYSKKSMKKTAMKKAGGRAKKSKSCKRK